jgi:beta-phosphoglucomutase
MKKLKPEAVIFDLDGIIIDTMPYHRMAWQDTLKPLGVNISKIDVYLREGEKYTTSARDFLKIKYPKVTKEMIAMLVDIRKNTLKKIVKKTVIFKGARELLTRLDAKGVHLGLVTATLRKEVKRMLPKNLYKKFDVIVTGDEVKNGKPHPEPYLKAIKKLGVKKKDAVVIENAPYGIRSAKKAGIFCVAIETSLPKRFLKDADLVVKSIKSIYNYLY